MILADIRSELHRVVKHATGIPCFGGRLLNYEVREMPFCDIRLTVDQLNDKRNGFEERDITCTISIAFKPKADTELESIERSGALFDAINTDEKLSSLVSDIMHEKTHFMGGMEGSIEVGHTVETYVFRYQRPYPEAPAQPLPTEVSVNGESVDV